MANAVDLAIRVTSDTTKAVAGLDAATSKTSKLGKAGAIAGKALAAGLAIGAAAAVKFAASAAEDQQQAAKLANALKVTTGATKAQVAATEDWISAQGKAYGITDDQLRPALSSLATATKDVNKAQQLASIAMDISARRGLSLEAVSNKLAKAYSSGNVAALSAYGVAVKNADGTTKSLEQVTNSLAKTYKGAAASSAKTAAGQWQIAKVQAAELGEEIGYKLIPFLTKAAAAGLKVVDWISRNQTTAAALVGTLGSLLAITWAVSKAMQAWGAITRVLAIAQTLLNLALSANPIGLIVIGIAALVAGLILAYKKSETFRNIVNGAFGAIAKTVGAVVGFIKSQWKTMLAILLGPIGLAVAGIIKYRDKITGAFSAAIGWVKSHWKTILALLTGPIGIAVLVITKNWDKIKAGFEVVKDKLAEGARKAKDLVVGYFNAMTTPIQKLIDLVQSFIDKIKSIDFPDVPDWVPGAGRTSTAGRAFNNDGTQLTGKPGYTKVDVNLKLDDRRLLRTEQARARIYGGGQVTVNLA